MLLWLWCRPAAAAQIQPLAWEPPYAAGVSLKRKEKKNNLHSSLMMLLRTEKNDNGDYHHEAGTVILFLSFHEFDLLYLPHCCPSPPFEKRSHLDLKLEDLHL